MYYLVKETLGRKRCIDRNENDIYEDDQSYNCLTYIPFNVEDKSFLRSIQIRCINTQGRQTYADVYSD
jgi:hypothetical protein